MLKLTVVNGAARGTAFKLEDGARTIGRVTGNDVVLASSQVSRKHCTLSVRGDEVVVTDEGSANGTFVNGILVKSRKLSPGDRLSVGDFVLEVGRAAQAASQPQLEYGNVVPLRGMPAGVSGAPGQPQAVTGLTAGLDPLGAQSKAEEPPKSLQDKIRYYFGKFVLDFLHNLNEKHQWRAMMAGIFVALAFGSAVLSVYPVLERVGDKLEREARGRALFLARQVVDRNSRQVFEKREADTNVEFAEKEKGVTAAYVLDMEGRVIAPARKANQYLTAQEEAAFSAAARGVFAKKEKTDEIAKVYGNIVFVASPLRVFNPSLGKNVTVALGVVGYDRSLVLFDEGTMALAYIQAVILASILAVIAYFSVYRLTLRPLTRLNEEIDQVLKGNASGLSRKYKMEEIDPLIDVISAALQRASGGAAGPVPGQDSLSTDEAVALMRFFADSAGQVGVMVLSSERRMLHINSSMEEITGIRMAMAAGDEFANVVRDAAFSALVDDMVGRAAAGGAVAEDFEFSGTMYRMDCMGAGQPGAARFYVMTAKRNA